MNQESIVYGYIKSIACFDRAEAHNQAETNKAAINRLPLSDDWPFLTREMFSIPRVNHLDGAAVPSIIHFGVGYDGIEYEWNLWMKKFESLLQTMAWQSAMVHLQTELSGNHSFVWEADGDGHTPNDKPLNVRCEWNHELAF